MFCDSALKLSSSTLKELEVYHLQKFSLTWTVLIERMFQRYVYNNIKHRVLVYISNSNNFSGAEDYNTLTHHLLQFDKKMTTIANNWSEKWSLLQEYHMDSEDVLRRQLIIDNQEKMMKIKESEFNFEPYRKLLNRNFHGRRWTTEVETIEEAWALTVDCVKHTDVNFDPRFGIFHSKQCQSCGKAPSIHHT